MCKSQRTQVYGSVEGRIHELHSYTLFQIHIIMLLKILSNLQGGVQLQGKKKKTVAKSGFELRGAVRF